MILVPADAPEVAACLRVATERRITDGRGIRGLFLVPQSRPTRAVAECLILIWSASQFEDWQDRIVYLPF